MKHLKSHLILFCLLLVEPIHAELQLGLIELPVGFSIDVYAENVENARQMARGDNGTIFVGSRRAGKLWAASDVDGDQRAERVWLIDDGLNMPSGIEFLDGHLYVGAVEQILRYNNIEYLLNEEFGKGRVLNKQVFASGWLQDQEAWGRPNDILVMPDGALLVSDDLANVIYRISFVK